MFQVPPNLPGESLIPYVGLTVRKLMGHPGLSIIAVAPESPADACGIVPGDEMITFAESPVSNLLVYQQLLMNHARMRAVVPIKVSRFGEERVVSLIAAEKFRETVKTGTLPPMATLQDMNSLLANRALLQNLSDAIFTDCDRVELGLVGRGDFASRIREWMAPMYRQLIGDAQLRETFDEVDAEGTGFLTREQLPAVLVKLIKWIVGNDYHFRMMPRQKGGFPMAISETARSGGLGQPTPATQARESWALMTVPPQFGPGGTATSGATVMSNATVHLQQRGPEEVDPGYRTGGLPLYPSGMRTSYVTHAITPQTAVTGMGMGYGYQTAGPCLTFVLTMIDGRQRVAAQAPGGGLLLAYLLSDQVVEPTTNQILYRFHEEDYGAFEITHRILRAGKPYIVIKHKRGGTKARVQMADGKLLFTAHPAPTLSPAHPVTGWYARTESGKTIALMRGCTLSWHSNYTNPGNDHEIIRWFAMGMLLNRILMPENKNWVLGPVLGSFAEPQPVIVPIVHVPVAGPAPVISPPQLPPRELDTSTAPHFIPHISAPEYRPGPIEIKVLPPRPVTPPVGPPWIGFAVQENLEKNTIYIKDIAPAGPAEKSGLREKDEITTFGGERTLNMNDFRAAVKRHAYAVGMVVRVEYARDDEYGNDNALKGAVMLTVGSKPQKQTITDLPPMNTRQDLDVILNNIAYFNKVTTAVWSVADDDNSGFVKEGEFIANIKKWLTPNIGRVITEAHLTQIFRNADADGSGRLKKSEAPMLASGILNQARNLL